MNSLEQNFGLTWVVEHIQVTPLDEIDDDPE
jgi:hypothetical protein